MSVPDISIVGLGIRCPAQVTLETVDRLKEKMEGQGSFETVKLAGAKTDRKANEVRFNFKLENMK